MTIDYSAENYRYWLKADSYTFERKLEHETAFDGIVKIFKLRTNNIEVDNLLNDVYFGDFHYETESGIFLRLFNLKTSWPITTLVYLDFDNSKLIKINENRFSWIAWTVMDLGNKKYSIFISPNEGIEYQIN